MTPRHLGVLTRELAALVNAGLPLDRSLEILIDVAEDGAVRKLLTKVLDSVREGSSLADALTAHHSVFPPAYASMVRAGEAGGSLGAVLSRLAEYVERGQALRESVRSAFVYPIVLMAMAGLSVTILYAVVIPQLAPLFADAGQALPLAAEIVVGFGDAFRDYWWLMALAVAGLVVLARTQLRRTAPRYRWDALVLRMPFLGDVVAKTEVARLSRTLATLLGNGVPMLTALSIVGDAVGNRVVASGIESIAKSLKEGKGLAEPLGNARLFPKLAAHLVRVGEESGRLEEMLLAVADIYDREVRRAVERMLALLVPALTIALGIFIGAIIISMLSAILSVYELPL